MYRRITIAAIAAAATLALAACGGNDETPASGTNTTDAQTAAESSSNGPVVRVTVALDNLGVEWDSLTDPTYNAAANSDVRDINIGGYDAKIHEFRTEESAKAWSDASDSLGGIHVAFDNSAVSLNSEEGRETSEELAPRLAEELGGEAHVADDPMAAFDDLSSELSAPSDVPDPTTVSAPEPEGIWAPTGQGYQCPRTDAFVWDPANCTPENLGAGTAAPASDLSRYGNESGVDWQDKDTNSDWSDAEVDAYIACFEMYDYSDVAAEVC